MNTQQNPNNRRLSDWIAGKAIRMKVPLSGTFELSPVCNFSCKMCYVRKTQKEVDSSSRGILTLEDWRAIAKEAHDAGMLYLLLTGGEPLLWRDFWQLYEELVDMGFLVSINTNGSLIDDEAVARFKKRPPQKLNITLYGANDETYRRLCGVDGVFTRVDRAVRTLIDNQITVKLNCSLTPENAEDLEWIVNYSKEVGTLVTVATYMFPPVRRKPTCFGENERFSPEESARYLLRYLELDRGEERYRNYLENIVHGCVEPPGLDESCIDPLDGKIRCRAGKAAFWITWDGWMTPCGMMSEPKVDVKAKGFSESWKDITIQSEALRLSGVCAGCPNIDVCHPCAAIAYAETGTPSGIPTYLCRSTKEMCRIAEETLNKINKNQGGDPV